MIFSVGAADTIAFVIGTFIEASSKRIGCAQGCGDLLRIRAGMNDFGRAGENFPRGRLAFRRAEIDGDHAVPALAILQLLLDAQFGLGKHVGNPLPRLAVSEHGGALIAAMRDLLSNGRFDLGIVVANMHDIWPVLAA